MMATTFAKSRVSCRFAALTLILSISCACLSAASRTKVHHQERWGHSRIPRTVLRTILSDDFSSTLSSSPHVATASACEGFGLEIRQSGISTGQNFRTGISGAEDYSRRDRSPPQV
jgi:hypothetical protein